MDNAKKVYIKNHLLSKDIKKEALQRLQGHWWKSVFAFIPVYFLGAVGGYFEDKDGLLPFIIIIAVAIFSTVFLWGIYWAFIELKDDDNAIGIQSSFKFATMKENNNAFAVIVLAFVNNILIMLWTMLLIIPGIIKGYSYSQAYYLWYKDVINKNSKEKLVDYITESRYRMSGFKLDLFKLQISMLGWVILSILTLGLGFFFLLPYYSAANVVFSERLEKALKEQQEVVIDSEEIE